MDLARWERRTELPLAVGAALFLAAYSWIVLDPAMPQTLHRVLRAVDAATWAMFLVDYVVRVRLAKDRRHFVVHHVLDLLTVVLPLLRPLRLLRLVALLKLIDRRASRTLQGRVALYVVLTTALVLYAASLAELQAERGAPGSNIETFGTSLWWAVTTITTVGYGDHYPVTTTGRLVAVALMLSGVALLGVVTASLATWLVQRVQRPDSSSRTASGDDETEAEMMRLRTEVVELRAHLSRAVRPQGAPGNAPDAVNKVGDQLG